MIDPHVHCRDGRQAYKDTIEHVFAVADSQGVKKIFDMPNTDPPIMHERDVTNRLSLVRKKRRGDYFLWLGVTAEDEQLAEAVHCYNQYREVIGLKLYAGHSTGNLGVCDVSLQRKIYASLTKLHYLGVLAVHCEKEALMHAWDPAQPISHARARPEEAEVASLEDQLMLVRQTGFTGILHIPHISSSVAVELVDKARHEMRITCGLTPHHYLWDETMLSRPDGLLYKMNPPLRTMGCVAKIRQQVLENKIDWIETDHAAHPIGEKLFPPYASGFPSLYLYKDFVTNVLPAAGLTQEQIEKVTSGNIFTTFEKKLK
ncbi:dihydroorotase [Candidatus Woesearchaeota archaeon]|nr:dihydroorotase [Candidatus Woesearchaeota archaeon]